MNKFVKLIKVDPFFVNNNMATIDEYLESQLGKIQEVAECVDRPDGKNYIIKSQSIKFDRVCVHESYCEEINLDDYLKGTIF